MAGRQHLREIDMKPFFIVSMLLVACSSGEVVPFVDMLDVAPEFVKDIEEIEEVDIYDTVEEVIETCASSLLPWQCAPTEGRACDELEECFGHGPCLEPPCWGLCEQFPGQCLPAVAAVACTSSIDCGEGFLCVKYVEGHPGYCRARPYADACWHDKDCPLGQYCAGEVECLPGSFCQGVEMYGRCKERPETGNCYEDADCPNGYCDGAELYLDGSSDRPGVCVEGTRPSCFDDIGCKDSPDGNLCTGAFKCPPGSSCPLPDQPGFCARFGGFGSCWEDGDCQTGFYCRSASACRPGTLCYSSFTHPGSCGEAPLEGEGIEITVQNPSVGNDFPVIVTNRGAVKIYIDPCVAVLISGKIPGTDKWPDDPLTMILAGPFETIGCNNPSEGPWLPIQPGSGFVTLVRLEFSGSFKVVIPYKLGCLQWDRQSSCGVDYTAVSAPFTVK